MKKARVIKDFLTLKIGETYPIENELIIINDDTKIPFTSFPDNFEIYEEVNHIKEIKIEEGDLDDSSEKNWKIVLNVKCTEKRLFEIQNKIKQTFNL